MADLNSTPKHAKTCAKCSETKALTEFYGAAAACKVCHIARSKAWKDANGEKAAANQRKTTDKRIAERAAEKELNKEKRAAEKLERDIAKKARAAAYKAANKERFNAYARDYVKERRATDPEYVAHIRAKKVRQRQKDAHKKHDAHVRTRNNWAAAQERKALAAPARAAKAEAKAAQAEKAAFARNQKAEARAFFASIGLKLCNTCGLLHGVDCFHKNSGVPDGLMSKCKLCDHKRMRDTRRVNPLLRLKHNIRNSIRNAIVNAGCSKRSRTEAILGCTFDEFKTHIERQFTKGMRWELIGARIHVDHVVPLASAKTEEEIISLNHVSNLRPMWAEDNLAKSAKRLHLI